MPFLRRFLPLAAAAFGLASQPAFAARLGCSDDSFHDETGQRDYETVQEFVNSKRTIPLEEKDCNLSISGDVRFHYANITERLNCNRLRGFRGLARQDQSTGDVFLVSDPLEDDGIPFSTSAFDVELNLYFDYSCDRAWAVAWLQFDNDVGIFQSRKRCDNDPEGLFGSGCCEDLCLKKAYMGFNLCADGCARLDVEIGRRPLYSVFYSRVEFQSNFDGVLLRYGRRLSCWGDFYWDAGAFIVDQRANHYAWVTELGLLNGWEAGLDLRYSFIDWKSLLSHDRNRCQTRDPFGAKFRVSQIALDYTFCAEYLRMPAKLYAAYLYNHDAEGWENTAGKKENHGWYAGFLIGDVCREGDWAIDINYQYVEAQAIPGADVSGIGRCGNNLLGDTLTSALSAADARDFTNYKGWRFEGLYALTDNLSINGAFEFSREITKEIGGKHSYSKFEVQAIYAF